MTRDTFWIADHGSPFTCSACGMDIRQHYGADQRCPMPPRPEWVRRALGTSDSGRRLPVRVTER